MHARLILEFNIDPKVLEQRSSPLDHLVLSLPGQVCIKVKNVVILHAPARIPLRLCIPYRLEQAARREQALIQAEPRQA
ncbi:hypothetical protein D3C76_1353870 [compost metagenome]